MTVVNPTVAVTGVTLNKSELELVVGASETLTKTIAPAGATNTNVTWTSDNEAVATVENGKVVAKKFKELMGDLDKIPAAAKEKGLVGLEGKDDLQYADPDHVNGHNAVALISQQAGEQGGCENGYTSEQHRAQNIKKSNFVPFFHRVTPVWR